MDKLEEKDKRLILCALKKRIDTLWSLVSLSERQRKLYREYKLLFEKLEGDYSRYYEDELLNEIQKEMCNGKSKI